MPMHMPRCLVLLSSLTLFTACTSGGDSKADGKRPSPDEGGDPPPAAANTTISVASVQLIQDCPDTEVEDESAAAKSASQPMQPADQDVPSAGGAAHPGDGPIDWAQPCDQSTVQLALATDAKAPVQVEIIAVRLMSGNKTLTKLPTREPKQFRDDAYVAWDEQLGPGTPIKASYKLGLPDDWSAIEETIGESSFGHMFTLEIDVAVDGVVQTVRSAKVPREQPNIIVT